MSEKVPHYPGRNSPNSSKAEADRPQSTIAADPPQTYAAGHLPGAVKHP